MYKANSSNPVPLGTGHALPCKMAASMLHQHSSSAVGSACSPMQGPWGMMRAITVWAVWIRMGQPTRLDDHMDTRVDRAPGSSCLERQWHRRERRPHGIPATPLDMGLMAVGSSRARQSTSGASHQQDPRLPRHPAVFFHPMRESV